VVCMTSFCWELARCRRNTAILLMDWLSPTEFAKWIAEALQFDDWRTANLVNLCTWQTRVHTTKVNNLWPLWTGRTLDCLMDNSCANKWAFLLFNLLDYREENASWRSGRQHVWVA
jgi:hypothetical protein